MECELLMRLHRTARYPNIQGLGFWLASQTPWELFSFPSESQCSCIH